MYDQSSEQPRRLSALLAICTAGALAFSGAAFAQGQSDGKGQSGGKGQSDGKSQGEERSAEAPGQTKPAGEPAQPPKSQGRERSAQAKSKPARPAKPAKPAKPARPAPRGNAYGTKKGDGKPAPAKGGKGGGQSGSNPAGKTTICHATGSATNPYVKITISNHALKAHARHQDGRDIIPAPAEGCPGGNGTSPEKPGKSDNGHGKVTICHATGSATNPYVKITISESALEAHRNHQDGRDIIPAPEGDCVAPAGTTPPGGKGSGPEGSTTNPETPAQGVLGDVFGPSGLEKVATTPAGGVLGDNAVGGAGETPAAGGVLGENAQLPAAAVRRESGAPQALAKGRLPFTGADVLILLALGLGALVAGVALHRTLSRSSA